MNRILAIIVFAQFFCTAVWFASNAIMPDIIRHHQLHDGYLAHLTSAVQAGFITGTLLFALFTIADRFSPSRVFFCSAIVAAIFNLALSIDSLPSTGLLLFRFGTGFFLAGIYPVGMKIAADHFEQGLGRSLGFLVGALVLGTAFPHLLKSIGSGLPWKYVVYATSMLSVAGGLVLLWLVPDGPYRKKSQQMKLTAFAEGFKNKGFRAAALGYFGHMWELYTFWAFVPFLLAFHQAQHPEVQISIPLFSFLIIASGSVACVISGQLSRKVLPKKLATGILFLSCLCCLFSPLILAQASSFLLLAFLLFWGLVVVADSPMFSTLVAQNAPPSSRGTALTIVNCLGFAITIVSIQLINFLLTPGNATYLFMLLAIGPVLGLWALLRKKNSTIPAI